ncbi:WD40 repeat domain-containing protein [Nostoc sp. 'Lobaria pulmonaria (5183) cyanobiont']|uniref:WD40 repeat domain-containing protein n=1 Tax=Nostoc sp. 'Lobaria pulmonaria (5183) cyanobiont' TaxID=1618022 RepID=UPI001319FAA5|nr:WD40 repeat domain-containing protein [Nostoc sp. 'Lobaria pulmonaria (5183) cyanobiont']
MANPFVEVQVAALKEAINYGEAGLDLVIQGLMDESETIKIAAYLLLRQRTEPEVKQALQGFNHWQLIKCLSTLERYGTVISLPISPDGQRIFVGGYGVIQIWDWQTGTIQTRSLQGHSDEVNFFYFTLDGQTIIGGSWKDARIKAWDWQTGEIISSPIKEYSLGINSIAICSDGETIIVGCGGGLIKVWNWRTNQLQRVLEGHSGSVTVVISPDGKTLVSGGDNTIKMWNWETGELLRTLEEPQGVNYLAISFEKGTVISSNYDKIKLRDLQTGRLKLTLNEHPQNIRCLAISSDGCTLVSGSRTGTLKVWNLQTGELQRSIEGHSYYIHGLAFDLNKQIIVSSSLHEIKVWGVG